MEKYAVPDPVTSLPVSTKIDHYAVKFIPPDGNDNLIPVECATNGYCFHTSVWKW